MDLAVLSSLDRPAELLMSIFSLIGMFSLNLMPWTAYSSTTCSGSLATALPWSRKLSVLFGYFCRSFSSANSISDASESFSSIAFMQEPLGVRLGVLKVYRLDRGWFMLSLHALRDCSVELTLRVKPKAKPPKYLCSSFFADICYHFFSFSSTPLSVLLFLVLVPDLVVCMARGIRS